MCSVELSNWDEDPDLELSPAAAIGGLSELCSRCNTLARGLDVAELVRTELKRLAEAKQAELTPPKSPLPSSAPSPKGKAAKEKREILAAVEAYRKEHGSGSILKLAQLAKVNESELRDMILCAQVPITTWRAVGKALRVDNAAEERGANP